MQSFPQPTDQPTTTKPPNTGGAAAFHNAEDVWFWFIAARAAAQEGAQIRAGLSSQPRPCEPLDILQIIDRLYRTRRLLRDHLLVLRHYGVRHMRPDPQRKKEARAAALWRQAMQVMEDAFISKGILRPQHQNWMEQYA